MARVQMSELMDSVQLKNRIIDAKVKITYDGTEYVFQPGESKMLPRKIAEWFRDHSLYLMQPGDVNYDIPSQYHYKLVIVGGGTDESDLTKDEVDSVKELLDAQHMPELTRVDPATGKPMRRIYIDPRSTGAQDKYSGRERRATEAVSRAIVEDGAAQIADAVESTGSATVTEADWKEGLPPLVNPSTGRAVGV